MDHGKVLGRAWQILWRYRVLWVFGVIVALCAAGTSGNPNFNFGGGGRGAEQASLPRWNPWQGWSPGEILPQVAAALTAVAALILAVVAALCCLFIIVTVAKVIFLYVGETALIRMVDHYEETGEKKGVRQGFRLGWSRTALRLFIIDLLTRVPGFIAVLLLVLVGVGVFGLFVLVRDGVVLKIIGTVAGIGVAFLVILAAIVLALAISFVRPLIFRVCALGEQGVIDSFRVGFNFIKTHLGDTAIMWLIMIGLQIGWVIVMIPVVVILAVLGAAVGLVAGLSVGGLTALVAHGAVPWIAGFVVGIPLFLLIMVPPLVFLGGLAEVYKSSVWTLTYRELRALEEVKESSGELPASASPPA
jgi:hypothetical protein